jgi:hypothetical protein
MTSDRKRGGPAVRGPGAMALCASAHVAYRSSIAAGRDKATVGWIGDDGPLGLPFWSLLREGPGQCHR